MKSIFFFFGVLFFLASCQNPKPQFMSKDGEDTTTVATKYTLSPFTPSQEFPGAALDSISYKNGKFMTVIKGDSYKLGEQTTDAPQKQCANSAEGQHVHLIVDTDPYIAKYTPTFDHDIADGEHYILTFLSRSYHESIKTDSAFKATKALVRNKSFESTENITDPMLFYSRPKGLYTGEDKKRVMLDFYLVNSDMSNHLVEVDINGEKHYLERWHPYYIEGLPDGDNTIQLSLLNKSDSSLVNIPLNPVTRTFQLEKAPETN